jgi:hypothetical protein
MCYTVEMSCSNMLIFLAISTILKLFQDHAFMCSLFQDSNAWKMRCLQKNFLLQV